jgi:hypothetical protein
MTALPCSSIVAFFLLIQQSQGHITMLSSKQSLSPILRCLTTTSVAQQSISLAAASPQNHKFSSATKYNEHLIMTRSTLILQKTKNQIASIPSVSKRNFSFYGNNPQGNPQSKLGGPSYQIYGETTALTVRAIPPEFRRLASGTIVTSNTGNGRGRLLLQWTPRDSNGKYQWDESIRFALAAEEAASVFMAQLDPQKLLLVPQQHGQIATADTVAMAEIVRRPNANSNPESSGFFGIDVPEKVFRATLQRDGSVQLTVDYERDGIGGQDPPTSLETVC